MHGNARCSLPSMIKMNAAPQVITRFARSCARMTCRKGLIRPSIFLPRLLETLPTPARAATPPPAAAASTAVRHAAPPGEERGARTCGSFAIEWI